MTIFFQNNLAELKKRFPATAANLEKCDASSVEVIQLPSGDYDLCTAGDYFYEQRPEYFAQKSLDETDFYYPKLLFFYGIGLGYHIRKFFAGDTNQTEHMLLIEKSLPVFRRALEMSDWTEIIKDPRVTFMVAGEGDQVIEDFFVDYFQDYTRLLLLRTIKNVFDRASLKHFGKYYVRISEIASNTCKYMNSFIWTSAEDSYRGFMNTMVNMPESLGVPLCDSLFGKFTGMPGIAVSTGPSLEKSLPWLKEVKDRAVIIASDSALRILLENGIVPHAACCLERVPETKLLIEGLPDLPDTYWITTPLIWPETYKNYPGPKLHMMRPLGQLYWFYPESSFHDTGSSVSHKLLVTLQSLGCSSVMLVGQDLAFDRHSSKTHAAGMPKLLEELGQSQRKASEDESIYVEGNNGEPILTMEWYNRFRKAFARLIRKGGVPVYNVIPSDYGAKIPHAELVDPKNALAMLGESRPISQMMREAIAAAPMLSYDEQLVKVRNRIDVAIDYLQQYRDISLDVLDSISMFRQQFSPAYFGREKFKAMFQRVEHIAGQITCDQDEFYQRFMLAFVHASNFDIAQEAEKILSKSSSETEQIESQIELIKSWFKNVHFWSSRSLHYLQRMLQQKPWL